MLTVNGDDSRNRLYEEVLENLEQASRQHAATRTETQDRQVDRAESIVQMSQLGVPRSTVAKLVGMTKGRVQQILEEQGAAGAAGDDWSDPELRRLVKDAIAARPHPSAGVGLRRESTFGPHLGRGAGVAVRLTGDLDADREHVLSKIEDLAEKVRSGKLDDVLTLSAEEHDVVHGDLIDD